MENPPANYWEPSPANQYSLRTISLAQFQRAISCCNCTKNFETKFGNLTFATPVCLHWGGGSCGDIAASANFDVPGQSHPPGFASRGRCLGLGVRSCLARCRSSPVQFPSSYSVLHSPNSLLSHRCSNLRASEQRNQFPKPSSTRPCPTPCRREYIAREPCPSRHPRFTT